ncbi:MAG: hypothetical protein HY276_11495 [Ignavibacteriales bacterium]|nr:hypothetical protein [Ignavibacteriales bacterium]
MRLDLPSKLAFVFLMWVCAFTLPWLINGGLILLLLLIRYTVPAYKPISKKGSKAFNKFFAYALAILLLLLALNALLIKQGSVLFNIYGLSFYKEGFFFGLTTAVRLLLLSFSVLLFFASIQLPDFIKFMHRAGLPPSLVLVLLLTLHFLEQLPDRINQIFIAQEARGAPIRAGVVSRLKAFFVILSPLVLSSIVESIDRGTALELRGFLSERSVLLTKPRERVAISPLTAILLIATLALILFKMTQWLLK